MLAVRQLVRVSLEASQDHALGIIHDVITLHTAEQLASSAIRAPTPILVATEPVMEDPLKALRARALISIRVIISDTIQARSGM